jgi:hypothetical protein
MSTLSDVCFKLDISPASLGNIPLNIPISVLQQSNNYNIQLGHAATMLYNDDYVQKSWIWSMMCVYILGTGTMFFVKWNDEIHSFNLDDNCVREIVFNAIFWDEYHNA